MRRLTAEERRARLQVNTSYQDRQAAKREEEMANFSSNEVSDRPAVSLTIVRQHIQDCLEFNDIAFDESIVRELIQKFQYTPLCDIKAHAIIKEYYKIESLHKYMIR